jgi:ribokinase
MAGMSKQSPENLQSIIVGSLNTDVIAAGVDRILGPGELTFSGTAHIGPGGKSRNIAQMIAAYRGRGTVALIGKTVKDPYNLWSVPFQSLVDAGVNTDFVSIESYQKTGKLPGIALIPVDTKGNNQIYVLPGINNDFHPRDVEACGDLFSLVRRNNGILGLTLELPLETARRALELAEEYQIEVVLDPGGIDESVDYKGLLENKIMILKPNEYEAEILSGIRIEGLDSAEEAAQRLFRFGIRYVFITHGEKGAYLITREKAHFIRTPKIGKIVDSTGCGDQVTATLIAELMHERNIVKAAQTAVTAGTLQATRLGIDPVKRADVTKLADP